MADRSKKESTPPPLLLMPAGGGLTLTPPEQPSILMPVVQPTTSPILSPEEEAEADSFIGQSTAPSVPHTQPSSYFQGSFGNSHDPFGQVGMRPPPPPMTSAPTAPVPSTNANPGFAANSFNPQGPVPPQGAYNAETNTPLPPQGSSPAATGNIYRQKGGRPQYAPPPTGFSPQVPASNSSPFAPPIGQQPPMAMVPPMPYNSPSSGAPPFPPAVGQPPIPPSGGFGTQPPAVPPQPQDNNPGIYTGGLFFQPVRHHWCFREDQEGIEIWRPFSMLDSMNLEVALKTKLQDSPNDTIIQTNGGRYDVNVGQRTRTPVYWNSPPVSVKRCSWFFKREGDNRYIPYEEEFSSRLEEEYKKAMETNGWHRRLEFPGNIVIVMHNASVIVQFPASAAPDEWGNVQGDQMRPRVVKRGVDDFAEIQQGEGEEVDHLVFLVPGIEDISGSKHRSVELLVDDFRSNALSLMESHFTEAYRSKTVHRVEFLPVIWTQALEEGVIGLKEQMEGITLPSTAKLRHFVNNSLVDNLFYTSPLYCQKICETVGSEMNRMFHIFLERNQAFSGDVSVAGHSLGAVILFDLLLNQRLPGEPAPPEEVDDIHELELSQNELSEASSEAGEEKEEEEEQTLEDLLSKIGLQDKANLFHHEQIDVDSLLMCTEQDLKDIGLQMGPRKKLLGFLHEEKMKKDTKAKEVAEKKLIEALEKKRQSALTAAASALPATSKVKDVIATGLPIDPKIDGGKWYELKKQRVAPTPTSTVTVPQDGWHNFPSTELPKYFNYGHMYQYFQTDLEDPVATNKPLKRGEMYYTSGHVQNLLDQGDNNYYHLKARVLASYDKVYYNVSVCLCKLSGAIKNSSCTCKASALGRCNHVAGLLYALNAYIMSFGDQPVPKTSKLCEWNRGRSTNKNPQRVQDAEYGSCKVQKILYNPITSKKTQESTIADLQTSCLLVPKSGWASIMKSVPADYIIDDERKGVLVELRDQFMSGLKQNIHDPAMPLLVTVDQNTDKWHSQRSYRITASNAKAVFTARSEEAISNLIKRMLWMTGESFVCGSVMYGREMEECARNTYIEKHLKSVYPYYKCVETGFWISGCNPELGCSPDGIILNSKLEMVGLLEIKCPYLLRDSAVSDFETVLSTAQLKRFCLTRVDGNVILKRNHNYYYQIQMQLGTMNLEWCDFVVFTKQSLFIERINIDRQLWDAIKSKLTSFYFHRYVPEIFEIRTPRNLKAIFLP